MFTELILFSLFLDITEIGRCAKAYCEHTARSVPTLSDTVVTLIEMGKTSYNTYGLNVAKGAQYWFDLFCLCH